MMKVYMVTEVQPCDDPYYAAPPTTVAVYASLESAQANVDAHNAPFKPEADERGIEEREMWQYFPLRWVNEIEVQP